MRPELPLPPPPPPLGSVCMGFGAEAGPLSQKTQGKQQGGRREEKGGRWQGQKQYGVDMVQGRWSDRAVQITGSREADKVRAGEGTEIVRGRGGVGLRLRGGREKTGQCLWLQLGWGPGSQQLPVPPVQKSKTRLFPPGWMGEIFLSFIQVNTVIRFRNTWKRMMEWCVYFNLWNIISLITDISYMYHTRVCLFINYIINKIYFICALLFRGQD